MLFHNVHEYYVNIDNNLGVTLQPNSGPGACMTPGHYESLGKNSHTQIGERLAEYDSSGTPN